jgi:hypothetical protein
MIRVKNGMTTGGRSRGVLGGKAHARDQTAENGDLDFIMIGPPDRGSQAGPLRPAARRASAPLWRRISAAGIRGALSHSAFAGLDLWGVISPMTKISYAGYRFPPETIQQAIWLYVRFTLSFRDVEDLLAERGIMVSYETVRRWVNHFGPKIAADLRKRRPKPHTTWHLDEVYLKIDGRMVYLWRAVDAEGEVLDVMVQSRRNKWAVA